MKVYIFELDTQEVNEILKSGRTVMDFLSGATCAPPSGGCPAEAGDSDYNAMCDDLFDMGEKMTVTHTTDDTGRTVKVSDKAVDKAKRISNTIPNNKQQKHAF